MKIQEFREHLKSCSADYKSELTRDLRVKVSPDHKFWLIIQERECNLGHTHIEKIKVKTKKAQESLTIFQTELLWKVFLEKVRPRDYAQYHKCKAGEEFIENIESVEVVRREQERKKGVNIQDLIQVKR